jgi:hypothetical protein
MPAEAPRSNKVLTSKDQIKFFFGNISDATFKKYVKQGMPAFYDNGAGWCAHTENLEEWWKVRTRLSMASIIDQIPE